MSISIEQILRAIDADQFRITDHADEEAAADDLSLDEILDSVRGGEVIEQYPTDRPYPSCLIHGSTRSDEPVHSVWAYNETSRWAVLVTVYRPDPDRWIDSRRRKPS